MSLQREPKVDRRLIGNVESLLQVDTSYTGYSYEEVTPSNGADNWGPGQNLTFNLPVYEGVVYDFSDSYWSANVDAFVNGRVDVNGGTDIGPSNPLHGFCNLALETFFNSGLLEDVMVKYGGSTLRQFDTNVDLFPLLHSVYTLFTLVDDQYQGDAMTDNYLGIYDADDLGQQTPQGFGKSLNSQYRSWTILNDSVEPYNVALGSQVPDRVYNESNFDMRPYGPAAPSILQNGGGFPFPVSVRQSTFGSATQFRPVGAFNTNWQYRSSLILNPGNTITVTAASPINAELNPVRKSIVMKLKAPFFNDNWKKPANIPIQITFKRSKNDYKLICGNSKADLLMSTGADVRNHGEVINSNYSIRLSDINLYVKRLTLSETQMMVLRQTPLMIYDRPIWHCQSFDLTSSAINKTVDYSITPQLVMCALVPSRNIVDPDPLRTDFEKYYSVYNTCRPYEKSFTELFINTSYGRVPESPYQPANDDGSINGAQSVRAYNEFLKSMKLSRHPLGFKLWAEQHTWYCFLLNKDGNSPMRQATKRGKSSINIQARTTQAPSAQGGLADNAVKLVVVAMELAQFAIQDLKTVTASV